MKLYFYFFILSFAFILGGCMATSAGNSTSQAVALCGDPACSHDNISFYFDMCAEEHREFIDMEACAREKWASYCQKSKSHTQKICSHDGEMLADYAYSIAESVRQKKLTDQDANHMLDTYIKEYSEAEMQRCAEARQCFQRSYPQFQR